MSDFVDSAIVAATVFGNSEDRARVTRRGVCRIEAGERRVEFADLPLTLDPDSVRVAARSQSAVTMLGVDVRKVFPTRVPVERIRLLEDKLQGLHDEDTADADRIENLKRQVEQFSDLGKSGRSCAREFARGKTSLDQQATLIQFVFNGWAEALKEIRKLEIVRRDRARSIEQAKNELALQRNATGPMRFAVAIDVRSEVPAEVEFDLVYLVKGAHWKPLYDVRFRADRFRVTYLGEIEQKTGEDWTGVALTLSTARPTRSNRIPRLEPWNVGKVVGPHFGGTRGAPDMMMTMAAPTAARVGNRSKSAPPAIGAMPELQEAAVEVAKVEATGAAVSFQIASAVDVPSDGMPRKATIGIFELTPKLDYVAVPKIEDFVYRRAKTANTSAFTFLAGNVQLFIDDDFVGATHLPLVTPNEKFDLFLGIDDRLRIERRQCKREFGKSMLGGRKRIQYGYQIKLNNHTGKAQEVTIVDHFPRPQHEDIKVTLNVVDPKPDRQDDLNVIVWKFTIESGVEKKIAYEFTVDHPREMDVSGL